MISKTLGTILIAIVCVIMFPVVIAILGGVFGIIAGVFGAVFGAIGGVLGGLFGAVFGVFEWMFDGVFGWNPFGFFHCNSLTLVALVVVVALIIRSRTPRR
jgi:hypothetical protein